eukprot:16450246-Heterocapsa_arctica.AAC.1
MISTPHHCHGGNTGPDPVLVAANSGGNSRGNCSAAGPLISVPGGGRGQGQGKAIRNHQGSLRGNSADVAGFPAQHDTEAAPGTGFPLDKCWGSGYGSSGTSRARSGIHW